MIEEIPPYSLSIRAGPPGGGGWDDRLFRFRAVFGFWYCFEPEMPSGRVLETSRNRKGNEHSGGGIRESGLLVFFGQVFCYIFAPQVRHFGDPTVSLLPQ